MQEDRNLVICRLTFVFAPRVGGSVTHIIELSQHINPYCRKQFLIVPKAKTDTMEVDHGFDFEVCRVPCFKWVLDFSRILSYGLFALVKISSLNRQYNITIIQAHDVEIGIIATIAGKIFRKPVFWMVHGTFGSISKRAGIYESIITRLFKPDHVFALDDGTGAPQKFAKLLGKDRVTAVYHAIDTQRFYPKTASRELVSRLGLENKFTFICANRLVYWKNSDCAILAFSEFLKITRVEHAVLLVIGEGHLKKELKEMVARLNIANRVRFLGEVDNSQIPDYLSASDVVLATSLYSNVSRSVQEAMACGKPVVAFNSGGTGDLIQDMKTGLLAKSGDIKDFTEKMLLLYRSPKLRKEIGENARRFIEQNRGWESRIEIELGVYQKLLSGKRKL